MELRNVLSLSSVAFRSWMRRLMAAGLLAFSAASYAQPPAPVGNAGGGYRISGKIVDAQSGAALAGCSVQIASVKARAQTRTVHSAADGGFSFSGLSLGKYSLSAERHGYLAQAYKEHEQFSTAIAVGPGLLSEGLTFELSAEALIGGTVIDEAGEPVRGAQVRLFADQDTRGVRATEQRQSATTDDRGVYEISGVRPGAYFLVVTAHPWYAQPLTLSAGSPSTLNVAYPTTFYPGVTDQDAATPIPVKGGDHLEANLTLAAQPALRLHINLPAGASRQVAIMLSQTIFGQSENLPTEQAGGGDGGYDIVGVVPGHYDVSLSQYGQGRARGEQKHFTADVSSGATELSEESAAGEIVVTGKVVSGAGRLPANGGISLRSLHSNSLHEGQFGRLDQAGEFSLSAPPGTYEVVGHVEGMYLASVRATGASIAGRMLTLKAGDAPRLTIVTGNGYGEIEGTVTRNGKPASAVMVLLAPEDAAHNQVLFRRDQSDSDGTFDLSGIVPGKYRLLAIEDGWQLEWANPAVLQAFLARSVPIEVRPEDHLQQSIVAQPR